MRNFEKLNTILLRVLKLFYLNVLWMGGTLVGLVIFGLGPSTAAVFSIIREWYRGNDDQPIFKTYVKNYKSYFKESFVISLIYGIIGLILIVDFIYMARWEFRVLFGVLLFFYFISASYIFPILVHYNLKTLQEKIKYSFLIGFSYLQYTLVMFVIIAAIYFSVAYIYPALFTFFGFSFLIFLLMGNANMVFRQIEASVEES